MKVGKCSESVRVVWGKGGLVWERMGKGSVGKVRVSVGKDGKG